MSINPDSGAECQSKPFAVQCIQEVVEACPFPVIANDWELSEIKCCAMNDHYVHHMRCPKEQLLGKNNRVLDPTHHTSLPSKVRLGIRASMSYGHNFYSCFTSVKTADRHITFMKEIGMRMCALSGHRFIFGIQRTQGDRAATGDNYKGDPVFEGTMNEWWTHIEQLVLQAASQQALTVSWVSPHEAAIWGAQLRGVYSQTEQFCRKEQLNKVLLDLVEGFGKPVALLDPFLPECPVIALNAEAQKLTKWGPISIDVSSADQHLEQLQFSHGAGGAYHINYGAYTSEEDDERLEVRTACCNGRPCFATFRRMYEYPDVDPVLMSLQGVTLGQGVHEGPLSGDDVWYLVAIFGQDAVGLDTWRESAEVTQTGQQLADLITGVLANGQQVQSESVSDSSSTNPYGGEIMLLGQPVWHEVMSG
jgi:hypothetical protein